MKKPRPSPKPEPPPRKAGLPVSPSLRAPLTLLDDVAEILASHVPEEEVEAALVSLAVFAELHPDMRDRLRFLMARDVAESGPVGEVDTNVGEEPSTLGARPAPRSGRPSDNASTPQKTAGTRGRATGRKR